MVFGRLTTYKGLILRSLHKLKIIKVLPPPNHQQQKKAQTVESELF
jgi:hypothetical protein